MEILIQNGKNGKREFNSQFKFQYGDTHTQATINLSDGTIGFKFQYGDTHTHIPRLFPHFPTYLNSNMEILIRRDDLQIINNNYI